MQSIVVGDYYRHGSPVDAAGTRVKLPARAGGEAQLRLKAREDQIECIYSAVDQGCEPTDYRFAVAVSWDQQNFGGRRAWLHCKNYTCERRARKLYLELPELLCRPCAGVSYASQSMSEGDRTRKRMQAIVEGLGGRYGGECEFPPKPAGMHWQSYDRLLLEYRDLYGHLLELAVWPRRGWLRHPPTELKPMPRRRRTITAAECAALYGLELTEPETDPSEPLSG